MTNDKHHVHLVGRRGPLARAVGMLLLGAAGQAAVTILHFLHGAHTYDDPGRLHVVVPALLALLLVAVLSGLLLWRPGTLTLAALLVATFVPFVAVFGLFHGGYLHGLKLVLFAAGASAETLERLFASPDFVLPSDLIFELSGLLTLFGAAYLLHRMLILVRMARPGRPSPPPWTREVPPDSGIPSAGKAGSGGSLRLAGLALRMLFDAPFKSLGTLIGVTVSVFLMAQQSSLLTGILGRVASFVNGSGVDIWVTSLATEATDATDSLPASKVGAVAGTPGVAWAAPVVQAIGKVTRPDGVRENVKVMGVEAPRYAGLPRTLAPGTTPSALRASGRILLNWNDRPTFAAAEPGDRVEIEGNAGVVAGFFQGLDPHNPFYYVYANIDDARALAGYPQDRITFIAVGVAPGQRAVDVKARLEARIPGVLVKTREELRDMEERFFLVRTPVGLVFGMGSLVAAFIGAAIVAVTLYASAIDRARDYGTLKAIGARRRDILSLMLSQAWLFAGAGYLLGMGAFFLVRFHYPQLPMVAPPRIVLGVAAAAFASCTLASLAAIRRVLQLDAAIVFRA
jgi:putative ABC transport system permease protein